MRSAPHRAADAGAGAARQAASAWAAQGRRHAQRDRRQRAGSAVHGRCAKPKMGGRLHLHLDGRGLAVCGRGAGPVLQARCGLVDAEPHDLAPGSRCADDGRLAPREAAGAAASLRPGQPVHERALPGPAQSPGYPVQHEPRRRGVGQLGNGELLQLHEDRTNRTQGLPNA